LCGFSVVSSPLISGGRAAKAVRLHAAGGSLADVLSAPPARRPPRENRCADCARASVLARPQTAERGVATGSVLFDADRRIQIADWSSIRLENRPVEPFPAEKWSQAAERCAGASL
jgi:hypothetical protein